MHPLDTRNSTNVGVNAAQVCYVCLGSLSSLRDTLEVGVRILVEVNWLNLSFSCLLLEPSSAILPFSLGLFDLTQTLTFQRITEGLHPLDTCNWTNVGVEAIHTCYVCVGALPYLWDILKVGGV